MTFDLSASSPRSSDASLAAGGSPGSASNGSPIADLSYRSYDGPLHSRASRWWVVSLVNLRTVFRKPWFWVISGLAVLPYFAKGVSFYFQSQLRNNPMNPMAAAMPATDFRTEFFQTLDSQAILLFVIALVVGSSSIAADNAANALLVYLSKPVTKTDYLLGKWMGIALPVFAVAAVPALLLYLFCLLSFSGEGFWQQDRILILRVVLATAIPAILHASLLLGCSAWSKSARMAGAVYAGLYFGSQIIAGIIWAVRYHSNPGTGTVVRQLSVQGVMSGLAQNAYYATIAITTWHRRHQAIESIKMHPPTLWIMAAVAIGLIVLGIAAARARVRAVEVVRG